MRDLLRTLKAGRTWREVAAILAGIGGVTKSPSWWLLVARGDKAATRQDANAIRACFPGWPDIPPSAGEALGLYGIERAVIAAADPDTAVLLQTDGAHIVTVLAKVSATQPPGGATSLVTLGNIAQVKRRDRKPIHALSFSNLDAESPKTNRRKTGDLTRISRAIQRARAAFDYVPNADEVAAWMATLNQTEAM